VEKLKSHFAAGSFLRSIAVLATGTAVAQVLTILAYPILMRLFDPRDFGLFALLGAIVMTVVVMASGRYELAIVLERTEKGAVNVLALSLLVTVGAAVLTGVVLGVFGGALMRLFGTEELQGLLPLLPLSVLVFASYQVICYWSVREKTYGLQSVSNVARSFGVAVFQILLGLVRMGPGGLVVGQILGQVVAVAVLCWQTLRRDGRRMARLVSWREIRRLAVEHRDFPIYNVPRALLNSTSVTAPSILLTAFFGPAAAGLYWFAYRLLELPVTLIGDATRRVFYERAVSLHNAGCGIRDLFVRTTVALGLMALGPAVVLAFAAPPIFEFAFGAEWREAGVLMQWLVGWWTLKFAGLPAIMMVPILRLQPLFLAIEVVALVPRLAIIPLAAMHADLHVAIAGYSLTGALYHLACTVAVLWHVRRNDERLRGSEALAA